jgi:tetratricopeptide (TPR) repeat protein
MMPLWWVTDCLLPAYMTEVAPPEEQAWVLCMIGEMYERKGDFQSANDYYEAALGKFSSPKAAWRLCRARFMLGDYAGSLSAYEQGVVLKGVPQILDDGPVYAESTKILAGQACFVLGEHDRALELLDEAVKAFPTSETVLALRNRMRQAKTIG